MDRNTQHKDVNSLQIAVAFSQSIFFSLYPLYFKGLKNLKQPPDFFPQTSSLAFIETNASEEENKVITLSQPVQFTENWEMSSFSMELSWNKWVKQIREKNIVGWLWLFRLVLPRFLWSPRVSDNLNVIDIVIIINIITIFMVSTIPVGSHVLMVNSVGLGELTHCPDWKQHQWTSNSGFPESKARKIIRNIFAFIFFYWICLFFFTSIVWCIIYITLIQ